MHMECMHAIAFLHAKPVADGNELARRNTSNSIVETVTSPISRALNFDVPAIIKPRPDDVVFLVLGVCFTAAVIMAAGVILASFWPGADSIFDEPPARPHPAPGAEYQLTRRYSC